MIINTQRTPLFIAFLLTAALACQKKVDTTGSNRILASVYNRTLYLSAMDGLFAEGATHDDSQQVIHAFVDRWMRDQLIMVEAERNVPKDLNIDELVQKYRESLILTNYEENLTKIGLDTTISDEELNSFYQKNKEQYQLETPIMRCNFLKIPRPTPQYDSISKWWNNARSGENFKKMKFYAQSNAKNYILEDSLWTKVENIGHLLPKGALTTENVSKGQEMSMKDDEFQYYLRVLSVMNRQEIAPLSYIREQASKYILHKRKIQLLEQRKQEMYDKELRKNNVKIYN